ncbi:hypothetical protein K493DRAFT_333464 [Basidiobolus meristosporus CBS 931.73]|uniref:RING-type domain-containing protein n=1 Tax=Basidiobolus meristosporus CBS 931.73 TaxID=1314790 RepID=A0A1Y1Z6M5_9FUNG|nr:hypothetical protein K493DRAFT_333464 [Basidiobolus meristosporus CBS 931.73]|eukprot:ORY05647.1 hypothetical protein K493DRAFT_333464 [Basidiobolus meristosporus CBS 931.73]
MNSFRNNKPNSSFNLDFDLNSSSSFDVHFSDLSVSKPEQNVARKSHQTPQRAAHNYFIPPESPLAASFFKTPKQPSQSVGSDLFGTSSTTPRTRPFERKLFGAANKDDTPHKSDPELFSTGLETPQYKPQGRNLFSRLESSRAFKPTLNDDLFSDNTSVFKLSERKSLFKAQVPEPEVKSNAATNGRNGPEDSFGLGSFDDVFITEEDLEKAREKLAEDQVKTNEQVWSEHLESLLAIGKNNTDSTWQFNAEQAFEEISICSNYITLGHGKLNICQDGIRWEGELLSADKAKETLSSQPSTLSITRLDNEILTFGFDVTTDIRHKCLPDDQPTILVTIGESRFLQFLFKRGDEKDAEHFVGLVKAAQQEFNTRNVSANSQPTIPTANAIQSQEKNMARKSPRVSLVKSPIGIKALLQNESYKALVEEAQSRRQEMIQHAEAEYKATIANLIVNYESELSSQTSMMGIVDSPVRPAHAPPEECQLCFSVEESKVIKPCGHRMCEECAVRLKDISDRCPWDRVVYTSIEDISG